MNRDKWQKAKEIFEVAMKHAPAERKQFLDKACNGDEELRREVNSLLSSLEDSEGFLENPAVGEVADVIIRQNSRINQNLNHYKIIKLVGSGGMGEVFLAEDTRLRRKVALKILPPNIAADKERLHRFQQEAFTASSLNHPNILTIHEFGEAEGAHFLATEFVEGVTLREKLKRDELSLKETINIAEQIAFALSAAHAAGIIHRDIKPENVMIRADGIVKILDFGLAKLIEKNEIHSDAEADTRPLVKTNPGTVMGTVAYMSPEQARGKETDARTDIFSLGVVIYEMIAGRTPFKGETASDYIASILKNEPPPIQNFNPETPAELERIVAKTLAKDTEERYQTAKDLLIDLKRQKKQGEISAEIQRAAPGNESSIPSSDNNTQIFAARPTSSVEHVVGEIESHKIGFVILSVLLLGLAGIGYWFFTNRSASTTQIESIAVMPFVNESGNADVEYLSDGMTDSLINSLSQLPRLSVKARSSVFRYKGKDTLPQTIAAELSVQAILNGRVVQRGNDLALYLSLVDARNGNQLWGEQYNRKLTDLVALQGEIARDVSQKLRARLSGADEQRVTKDYTSNAEAYQLYLRGRYHVFKLTPPEVYKGISYFQQAITIDPSYALAYAGLSDAYRSLALAGEMLPTEFFPKAEAAAQKAIEIDDRLAEGHTTLGVNIFWYHRDWKAAENEFKRALKLNPNDANAHLFYAHLLSSTGRPAEALVEVKRAREIDPVSPFVNALEGQFLIHAGRTDEALDRLQKTFELEPNFFMAHLFASSAYIEKGMYTEAVAEARRAKELSPVLTASVSMGSYALAKSGKLNEARAGLEELLLLSTARFVPPYHIALVYNGLGERDKTFEWLEKGFQQRDPKMTFLKVEPKWNNLRSDARFQDLLGRVGFPQ